MNVATRLTPLLALFFALACQNRFDCPDPSTDVAWTIEDRSYYTHYDQTGEGNVDYPSYQSHAPKVLTVDHEAGVVRVTYFREGRSVVETWAILATGVR